MTISVGTSVEVFIRYCPWKASDKFMVSRTLFGGTQSPRIGKSDGWVPATVVAVSDHDPLSTLVVGSPVVRGQWIRVQFQDKIWVDNRGSVLEEKSLFQWINVDSGSVRLLDPSTCVRPSVCVLCVRWGGQVPIDDKRFDFAVSDKLIQEVMDCVHEKFQKSVEIISAFVTASDDLEKINELWASEVLARGHQKAGMYFLWGSNNESKPGYVLSEKLVSLMDRMESVGIQTRYPNDSHLYRLITGKEYQALLCTNPSLAIPPTVAVSPAKFISDPDRTCRGVISNLSRLSSVTSEPFSGVVKVGCEWMGDGVRAFSGSDDLRQKAQVMLDGAHGRPRLLLIQERIENVVCEPRVFVYNGVVKGIRYTWNDKVDPKSGRIHALRTCPQSRAANERFNGDIGAQKFVERRIAKFVDAWNNWLIAAGGEVPVFVRIDFLVSKLGTSTENSNSDDAAGGSWSFGDEQDDPSGERCILPTPSDHPDDPIYESIFKVWTCELGEIGSSMVGFREGREMLFKAIAESCSPCDEVTVGMPQKPKRSPPPLIPTDILGSSA